MKGRANSQTIFCDELFYESDRKKWAKRTRVGKCQQKRFFSSQTGERKLFKNPIFHKKSSREKITESDLSEEIYLGKVKYVRFVFLGD